MRALFNTYIEKNIYIDKSLDLNVNCNPRYENANTDHFYKNNIKHKPVNFFLILASCIVLFYMVFENRLDFFSRKASFIKNK